MSFDTNLIITILQTTLSVAVKVFVWTWWIFAGVFAWETYQNYRKKNWVDDLEHILLKVEVPKDNEKGPVAAEMMFASLHGILKNESDQKKEGSIQEHISFELIASLNSIRFYVWIPIYLKDYLEGQLYAQYPTAEITVVDDYSTDIDIDDDGEDDCIASTELILEKSDLLPIKTFTTFEVDPLASITSVLGKLDDPNEQIWVQILAKPESNKWQEKSQSFTTSRRTGVSHLSFDSILDAIKRAPFELPKTMFKMALQAPDPSVAASKPELSKHEDAELAAIDLKAAKLGYKVKIRLMYLAKTREKAKYRLQAIVGSFKQFNTTLNGFSPLETREGIDALNEYRARFFDDGYILNIEELASIYHLPHVSVTTPNITWVTSKKSEPPANLPIEKMIGPDELTLFAQTNFRGIKQKFGIKTDDRRRHMYIIGKSGVGKSYLLALLAISDVYAGRGVCIIDPHGELAEMILKYIPEHRVDDVVYFNPSDTSHPIAFNALELSNPDFKETISSGFVSIFKKQFGYSWGPRLEYVLRYTVLALLDTPGTTMLGVVRMLTEKNYRQRIIKNIKDPVVKNFWEKEFASYNDRFQTEAVAPILNKVGQFIASPLIRNIVGQPQSTFDVRQIMDNQKILIINLSSGQIGEDNSALLGAMMITKIQLAAMSRADVEEDQRKDFYLYVDEFQNFATDSFARILSEARKYRLNLIVANQYISQMEDTVKEAVFGNVGSLISYRVGAKDASFLETEFSDTFSANDLINLDNQHIYLKMLIDGITRQPFSGQVLFLPKSKIDHTQSILYSSRQKYTRPKAEVEELVAKLSRQVGNIDEYGQDIDDNKNDQSEKPSHSTTKRDDETPASIENRISKPHFQSRSNMAYPDSRLRLDPHKEKPNIINRPQSEIPTQPAKQIYKKDELTTARTTKDWGQNKWVEKPPTKKEIIPSKSNTSLRPKFEKSYKTTQHNKQQSIQETPHKDKVDDESIKMAIKAALNRKKELPSAEKTTTNNHDNKNNQTESNKFSQNSDPEKTFLKAAADQKELKPGDTIKF